MANHPGLPKTQDFQCNMGNVQVSKQEKLEVSKDVTIKLEHGEVVPECWGQGQ